MIQVLCRAFTILEWMSDSPRQSRGLTEIARKIGVQSATASHIVKTLVTQGYVRKLEGRRGYVLGPMAHYLARKGPYRKDLVDLAEPRLRAFSEQTGEAVGVAVIQGGKRFVLCQAEGGHALRVNTEILSLDDLYHTATGRLLLAYANDSELKTFLAIKGLPDVKCWKEASTETGFREALAAIREEGMVLRECTEEIIQIAYPVREAGQVFASVGSFVPLYRFKGKKKSGLIRALKRLASSLSHDMDAMRSSTVASA